MSVVDLHGNIHSGTTGQFTGHQHQEVSLPGGLRTAVTIVDEGGLLDDHPINYDVAFDLVRGVRLRAGEQFARPVETLPETHGRTWLVGLAENSRLVQAEALKVADRIAEEGSYALVEGVSRLDDGPDGTATAEFYVSRHTSLDEATDAVSVRHPEASTQIVPPNPGPSYLPASA